VVSSLASIDVVNLTILVCTLPPRPTKSSIHLDSIVLANYLAKFNVQLPPTATNNV